jgi:transcriptional regulator with XRE-family HTH domain
LAEFSGLSIRTVQRVEQGQAASLETLKSLAAVFEVNVTDLQTEPSMSTPMSTTNNDTNPTAVASSAPAATLEERQAFYHVKKLRGFYKHALIYILVISGLTLINYFTRPQHWWVLYTAAGWGLGLLIHALGVFSPLSLFGPAWEKRQVEKRLGRSL